MRPTILFFIIILCSCSKSIEVELPDYTPEIVVEMYLEEGAPLRCLLSESLPYNNEAISKTLDSALVIFSDGQTTDTLKPAEVYDYESGRLYNFSHPRRIFADTTSTYTLYINDSLGREVSASTRFIRAATRIDSLAFRPGEDATGKYSVGFTITDHAGSENYYRFMIAKRLNDFTADNTDFFVSDVSFEGKKYSYYSPAVYVAEDTVTVRVYSLLKEHYDYLQSADNARSANFNPFVQPIGIMSSTKGGLGIFTTVRYDEKMMVIRN